MRHLFRCIKHLIFEGKAKDLRIRCKILQSHEPDLNSRQDKLTLQRNKYSEFYIIRYRQVFLIRQLKQSLVILGRQEMCHFMKEEGFATVPWVKISHLPAIQGEST